MFTLCTNNSEFERTTSTFFEQNRVWHLLRWVIWSCRDLITTPSISTLRDDSISHTPLLVNMIPGWRGSDIGFVRPASRHFFCFIPPSRPTKRFHPDPACLYLSTCNWCKRYWQTSLKMDRTHFVLLSNKRKYTGSKNLKLNPQWNTEIQNRMTTWKTSARGFSSLGLSVRPFLWLSGSAQGSRAGGHASISRPDHHLRF